MTAPTIIDIPEIPNECAHPQCQQRPRYCVIFMDSSGPAPELQLSFVCLTHMRSVEEYSKELDS